MSNDRRVLPLVLLLSLATAPARAEVLVRWDLDRVPSRESLGVSALVIPASKPEVVQEAAAKGFRVYLEVAAASLPADELDSAMAGMAVAISTASSGRASQVSLQREQRTVRPASPKAAGLMA